jgi:hypothetical protein
MQSAASGLIEAFKAAFSTDGTDWDQIAYDMYLYGGGGISCWGTLCGIPNGCVAACNLIGLHGALGPALLNYYAENEWPTAALPTLYNDAYYGSGGTGGYTWTKQPVPDGEVLAHTISHSPLCHISISKWCYAAGVHLGTPNAYSYTHKNDRCGKICADMTAQTAQWINDFAVSDALSDTIARPDVTNLCLTCHWKSGKDPAIYPAQCGQMACDECHTAGSYMTVVPTLQIVDVWASDPNATDPFAKVDTFNVGDDIRYNVAFSVMTAAQAVNIKAIRQSKVKDSAGTKLTALRNKEALPKGTHQWHWDDDLVGAATGQAKIKLRMQMGSRDPIRKLAYFDIV